MYCRNCGSPIDPSAFVCTKCGVQNGTGFSYCYNCGNRTDPQAVVCTKCGVALSQPKAAPQGEPKSKIAAGLMAIFLGFLGVHNFYLGYTGKAAIQLVVSLVGGLITCGVAAMGIWIWALIEGIMILGGSINTDANGVPLKT